MIQLAHHQYNVMVIQEDKEGNQHNYLECYTFGEYPIAEIGITVTQEQKLLHSCLLIADGGGSFVNAETVRIVDDVLFVAVGRYVVALALPELVVQWAKPVDNATCFGIYYVVDQQRLICHGECEISASALNGELLWEFSGKDIFTNGFAISGDEITVIDFNDEKYTIEIINGKGHLVT